MNGIDVITQERREQLQSGYYTPAHDDTHTKGEMLVAAECYMKLAEHQVNSRDAFALKMMKEVPKTWPWDADDWHPSLIAKNNLRKAGALLAAEWDRIDRAGF